MDRIHYSGGSVLTGSDIAHALLGYAAALAKKESSALVRIPIRLEDGTVDSAELLVGPASQLLSQPEVPGGEEIVDAELVERLVSETRLLGPLKAVIGEAWSRDHFSGEPASDAAPDETDTDTR